MHVGILATGYDFDGNTLAVHFTNMATGRVTVIAPNDQAFPAIEVIQPGDLSVGQMYMVTLVGPTDATGQQPLTFTPYVYDTTTGGYIGGSTDVEGIYIKYIKLFDGNGDPLSSTEQWASLK